MYRISAMIANTSIVSANVGICQLYFAALLEKLKVAELMILNVGSNFAIFIFYCMKLKNDVYAVKSYLLTYKKFNLSQCFPFYLWFFRQAYIKLSITIRRILK